MLQWLIVFFTEYGYFAVFWVLILCGLGLPVPEDITLVSGGIISSIGDSDIHIMVLVGMAGVLIGDLIVFTIGHFYGNKALNNRFISKIITLERFENVQSKFEKYGKWVIFTGRFMPGLRMPIYFTAGVTKKVGFLLFIFMDFSAAVISVPVWIYLGYFGANNIELLMEWVNNGQKIIFTIIGIFLVFMVSRYYYKKQKGSAKTIREIP